eukprot:768570-Hanusia_phi.AAC.6
MTESTGAGASSRLVELSQTVLWDEEDEEELRSSSFFVAGVVEPMESNKVSRTTRMQESRLTNFLRRQELWDIYVDISSQSITVCCFGLASPVRSHGRTAEGLARPEA